MKSENKPRVLFKLKDFQTSICCEIVNNSSPLLIIKDSSRKILNFELPKDLIESFFSKETSSLEIEAKYLLLELPKKLSETIDIEQAYPIITQDGSELRVRKKGVNKYYLSLKQGAGAVRSEFTLKISQDDYEALKEVSNRRLIQKKRFLIDLDYSPKLTLEVDQYMDHPEGIDLNGLLIAEIEFHTQAELEKFSPTKLSEFGVSIKREVTNESKFSNKKLALNGLKDIS